MIELAPSGLVVSFPEVHEDARNTRISFERTLRVPDDNQQYGLPASLGRFPLSSVDDFEVPEAWRDHGGVFCPMYQSEAMWINFSGRYPMALKVAAGKINAVTGNAWNNELHQRPQDYLVLPQQPWLDGFKVSRDEVRQFVARTLGEGLTAEEQITGKADWGGLQLIFYPMKADAYEAWRKEQEREVSYSASMSMVCESMSAESMGIAPGGRIRQTIEKDRFGLDAWETSASSRCFVHLLNSSHYHALTGQAPPTAPITKKDYEHKRIPWFDWYGSDSVVPGAEVLAGLDSVASKLLKQGKTLDDNAPMIIAKTVKLGPKAGAVREGNF